MIYFYFATITIIIFGILIILHYKEKQADKLDAKKRTDLLKKQLKEVESFAKFGDKLDYLGQEVTVVGLHNLRFGENNMLYGRAGLHVEWFDSTGKLQGGFIAPSQIKLCKQI